MINNKYTPIEKRKKVFIIIYETNTFWGKFFDVLLLIIILLSVVLVILESMEVVSEAKNHKFFYKLEWIITILFTIEYILRIACIKTPKRYIFSFYGIIDFVSILPLYLSYIFVGSHTLLVLRAFRLLRVFRILKIGKFLGEASQLTQVLLASKNKILVFIYSVVIISIISGTLMYFIEGKENGFTNIPVSIYWTIVTLTTVGFGDIVPQTALGQIVATIIMILGYGIIAVPTSIVTAEMTKARTKELTNKCEKCGNEISTSKANFCINCGNKLNKE